MKSLLRLAIIGLLITPVFGAKISQELDRYYQSYELAKSRNRTSTMSLIKEKIKFLKKYYDKMDFEWTPAKTQQSYVELDKKLHESLKNLSSQAEYRKFERDYKQFNATKYEKEYTSKNKSRVNETYTKNYYDKVVAQAKKLYSPIKINDEITVSTRLRKYTGKFGGVFGNRIKVGRYWVPTIDLPKDLLDRMKPEKVKKNRIEYVQKYYYQARDAAEKLYKRRVKNYVNKFKKEYYIERSKKMIEVWSNQYRADLIRTMSELDAGICNEFKEYKQKSKRNSTADG